MDLSVEPKTVSQQVTKNLRKAIVQGSFRPGDRLVEASLCNQLGVSRPSLREALRALEAEKLVVIRPNKGPSVALLTWDIAQQIYVVRALLEGEAAALAARYASPEQIGVIQGALNAFGAAVESQNAQARIYSTEVFYAALQQAGGNPVITEVLRGLTSRINFLRATSMGNGKRARDSFTEMRAILDAVEANDADRARQASMQHIQNAAIAAEAVFPHA
ncbi:MAG: GntR family transcriptional regulator [Pseudomonadota bacterium]